MALLDKSAPRSEGLGDFPTRHPMARSENGAHPCASPFGSSECVGCSQAKTMLRCPRCAPSPACGKFWGEGMSAAGANAGALVHRAGNNFNVCCVAPGRNGVGRPCTQSSCPAPQNGDSGWPLWPPGMWMMPSASWPGDTTIRSEAPNVGPCTRGMPLSPGSGSAGMHSAGLTKPGNAHRQRVADRGGVALAPGAVRQRALLLQVVAHFARGVLEQRIPTGEPARQQMHRALRHQRPGDAFELADAGHLEVLAHLHCVPARSGHPAGGRAPPAAMRARCGSCSNRCWRGPARCAAASARSAMRARFPFVPCVAQQAPPARQEHRAVVELDRQQVAFVERCLRRTGRRGSAARALRSHNRHRRSAPAGRRRRRAHWRSIGAATSLRAARCRWRS